MDTIRQLVDRRNKQYLPISIILVTSSADIPALKGVMKGREVADDGLTGVYYAGTPLHGAKVYALGGVIDPQGAAHQGSSAPSNLVHASESSFGSAKISKEGITDPMALKAWWYLSNGVYKAYAQVTKLTKRKGEVAGQAVILLDRVDTYLAEQAQLFLSGDLDNIVTYEKAERLFVALKDAKIKSLKDQTKELKAVLRTAAKQDGMKEELKARKGYAKLMKLVTSNKAKEKAQAIAGFRYIADTYAETHYGKLADLRALSLGAY